jgi:hypothetical protein
LRASIGRAGRRRAEDEFTYDRLAALLHEELERIGPLR